MRGFLFWEALQKCNDQQCVQLAVHYPNPCRRSSSIAIFSFHNLRGVMATDAFLLSKYQPRVSPPVSASTGWVGRPRLFNSFSTTPAKSDTRPACCDKQIKIVNVFGMDKGCIEGTGLISLSLREGGITLRSSVTHSWHFWQTHNAWVHPIGPHENKERSAGQERHPTLPTCLDQEFLQEGDLMQKRSRNSEGNSIL